LHPCPKSFPKNLYKF